MEIQKVLLYLCCQRELITLNFNHKNNHKMKTELEVAIGYEIAQLLSLKFSKDGRVKTSWGTKSAQGLGACIIRITEEQKERLK